MKYLGMIGAVTVIVSGAYVAHTMNTAAKRRLRQTEAFISLIRFIRSQIECFALPLTWALGRVPEEIYAGCGYHLPSPPLSGESLILECEIADDVTRDCIESFFYEVGKGYREQQLALCDHTVARLEERRADMASRLPIRIKVNSALSLAGAAAVVILLI